MREVILVAIDKGDSYGGTRQVEYIPPGDQLAGQRDRASQTSMCRSYETMCCQPWTNYRTLNKPGQAAQPAANLAVRLVVRRPAYCLHGHDQQRSLRKDRGILARFLGGPNFIANTLNPAPKLPLGIYMDIGSAENSSSQNDANTYWLGAFGVYNQWQSTGYAINSDLLMYPQCGAVHNEAAWSNRLPTYYQYALSLWSEPNPLALAKFPPHLDVVSLNPASGTARLHFVAPLGFPFTLGRSTDLLDWTNQSSLPAATAIWEDRFVDEQFAPTDDRRFWRLSY